MYGENQGSSELHCYSQKRLLLTKIGVILTDAGFWSGTLWEEWVKLCFIYEMGLKGQFRWKKLTIFPKFTILYKVLYQGLHCRKYLV